MSEVSITDIQIAPTLPNDGLVAFASFVINEAVYVGNVAIYTAPAKPMGFRLVYPAKKLGNGKKMSSAHPITRSVGDIIEKIVISKYRELMSNWK